MICPIENLPVLTLLVSNGRASVIAFSSVNLLLFPSVHLMLWICINPFISKVSNHLSASFFGARILYPCVADDHEGAAFHSDCVDFYALIL